MLLIIIFYARTHFKCVQMRAETMKRRNKNINYIYVRMIQIIFSKRSKNMKKEIETD